MKKAILSILRTSEFWAALAGAVVEVAHEPLPAVGKWFIWMYVGARLVGKVVAFVFPNPASANAGWLKHDP